MGASCSGDRMLRQSTIIRSIAFAARHLKCMRLPDDYMAIGLTGTPPSFVHAHSATRYSLVRKAAATFNVASDREQGWICKGTSNLSCLHCSTFRLPRSQDVSYREEVAKRIHHPVVAHAPDRERKDESRRSTSGSQRIRRAPFFAWLWQSPNQSPA